MDGGLAELRQFLCRHGHVPTSIDSWRSYLRRFSCSINTRIHGTMVAIQSGIPALCVCHDTRTRELAERMKLPALEIATFIEARYEIKRLFAATKFDGAAFDRTRQEAASEYIALFNELGLKPSPHLQSFASTSTAGLARVA
jgi:polysaccharide pyruvyl transferase WcaK-like protein